MNSLPNLDERALLAEKFAKQGTPIRPIEGGVFVADRSDPLPYTGHQSTPHGTTVEDMNTTTWRDWSSAAEEALEKLEARVPGKVVIAGLSMGGSLTGWLGTRHPEVAGLTFINAAVALPEGMREGVQAMVETGAEYMDGIGSDIADPDSTESAYLQTPLKPLLSLLDAEDDTLPNLPKISCPSLIITSRQDHVVPPENSDVLAEKLGGPVERIFLERSYHVATLDYEKADIETAIVEFARRVTS